MSATVAIITRNFVPRTEFPRFDNIVKSYFLGHHQAGLTKMRQMLGSVELIIECRDYRVPLSSRNPLFEQSLVGRERLIIYTKRDLGAASLDKKVGSSPITKLSHKFED